jgi:hypothetical protein
MASQQGIVAMMSLSEQTELPQRPRIEQRAQLPPIAARIAVFAG